MDSRAKSYKRGLHSKILPTLVPLLKYLQLNMRCKRISNNLSGSIFTDLGLIWLMVGVYPWLLSIP